ncbi:acetyltransferase (GNAT) family protein [Oerskovia enterophila]|uniref:Acetyltransferase (GNAT) family protein n=2 Tax=Oerskovia enterophila TaxID=43678 RepID=A0A163RGS2_9CELL|nr:acetyltransferase (GNAT) family protein [Oerskovia enterophila]
MNHSIRTATSHDLPAAARTLSVAFADYPWTRWTIPDDDYAHRLEELQSLYLSHAIEHGLVLVDAHGRGAVAVLPSSAPPLADDLQRQVRELHGDRLEALLAADLPAHPVPSWELATLGVRPEARGAGLGSALVDAVVAEVGRLDPGCTIALETSDDRNVRLYEGRGFFVTAHTSTADGPAVHSMQRTLPATS